MTSQFAPSTRKRRSKVLPILGAVGSMPTYHSQYEQDWLLDEMIFCGMRAGVFVDVGAHDGVSLSNTLVFERDRNWSGVCIEANPSLFTALAANRSATCLNVAVSQVSAMLPFVKVEGCGDMLSGLLNNMDPRHLERIHQTIKARSGSSALVQVPATPLSQILRDLHLTEVHYLSVDTEGNEADVLASVDFNSAMIHVISVEANYEDAVPLLLDVTAKHFEVVGRHHCDLFLINRRSQFLSRESYLRPLCATGSWPM